jgi:hypothetical protein
MAALASLPGPFLPVTRFSMRPSGILVLVNEIVINRKRSIVECGAGLSTIYIARALRDQEDGGVVISIDHDARWLETLHAQLRREELEDFVQFVHAPLVSGDWGMGSAQWYDPSVITSALHSILIDLLLVDGPVASDVDIQYARYPAVPVLREFFSESISVILDDINRPGERAIVSEWTSLLATTFELLPTNGRIGVAMLGDGLIAY